MQAEAGEEPAWGGRRPPQIFGVGDYWAERLAQTPPEPVAALVPPEGVAGPGCWDQRAADVLALLTARARGRRLDQIYPVSDTATPEGPCRTIRSSVADVPPATGNPHEARRKLAAALELVWGVGPWHAAALRSEGTRTLADLARHPRFGVEAGRVWGALAAANPAAAFSVVRQRCGASHPLLWYTRALFDPSAFLFVDIETLGFSGVAAILIGVAEWRQGVLEVTQYVAESVADEPALLAALAQHAAGKQALVTFNGLSFDVPVLAARAAYYGMRDVARSLVTLPHFDLVHFARRAWRDRLSDCQAVTIERELLGIIRPDDLPGAYVPSFYEAYQQDGEVGPLTYIIDHNRWDVAGLVRIFTHLTPEALGSRDVG